MDIYKPADMAEQKDIRKNAKTAMAVVSALAVVVCAVLLIVVKPSTDRVFRIIATALVVLAGCVDIYLASYVLPYMRPKPKKRRAAGKVGHVLGNILRQIHMYLLWGIVAGVFVSFLFNQTSDTIPLKKVTVWADVPTANEQGLESILDEELPEGIRMVKVHTFSYSLFGMDQIGGDDIYIVSEDEAGKYSEGFAVLEEFLGEGWEQLFPEISGVFYEKDGKPCGIPLGGLGKGNAAWQYLAYDTGTDYYLFFGKDSLHPGADGAAAFIAKKLFLLR